MTKTFMTFIGSVLIITGLAVPYLNSPELASFMSTGPTVSLLWDCLGFFILVYATIPQFRELLIRRLMGALSVVILIVGMFETWHGTMLVVDSFFCAIASIFMLLGSLELTGGAEVHQQAIAKRSKATAKASKPRLASAKS